MLLEPQMLATSSPISDPSDRNELAQTSNGASPQPDERCGGRFRAKRRLTQGPAVRMADRHHSLRRCMVTVTRSAYVQVRCAVCCAVERATSGYDVEADPKTADLTRSLQHSPPKFPSDFRLGVGHLVRGVAVVTSRGERGEMYGVTTAGASVVGVEPPTLVVCVRRRSKLGTLLPRTHRFCVNVLSNRQRTVAEAFAGRRGLAVNKFKHGHWTIGSIGSPVLADTLASFECELDLLYGYPDHMIVVGRVGDVVLSPEPLDPLVYSSGRLSSLAPSGTAAAELQ